MAATLSCTVSSTISWVYNSNTAGIPSVNSNQFSYSQATSNGTGSGSTADLMYAVQTTIAASGSTTIRVGNTGEVTDVFGSTITMARIKWFWISLLSTTTASSVNIGNASNPIANFLSATSTTISLLNNGLFVLGAPGSTGYAITNATADSLKIANVDSSNTATLQICLIGSST